MPKINFCISKHKRTKKRYGERAGQNGGWVEMDSNPELGSPATVAGHPSLLVVLREDFVGAAAPASNESTATFVSEV